MVGFRYQRNRRRKAAFEGPAISSEAGWIEEAVYRLIGFLSVESLSGGPRGRDREPSK